MRKILFSSFICLLTLISFSCKDEQTYILSHENFFTVSSSGAVSISSAGATSIHNLKNNTYGVVDSSSLQNHTIILDIPERIKGIKIVEIDKNGFSYLNNCDKLIIPNSVIKIGENAFFNSQIKEIVIPDSVTQIEESAFKNSNTKTLNISSSLVSIGSYAFAYCRAAGEIKTFTISKDVEKIGAGAFQGWERVEVAEENANYKIESNCLLTSDGKTLLYVAPGTENLTIPSTVETIENGCILDSKNIIIPVSVTKIGNDAFSDSVEKLEYQGTASDWKQIIKGIDWIRFRAKVVKVECTDGDVLIRKTSNTYYE